MADTSHNLSLPVTEIKNLIILQRILYNGWAVPKETFSIYRSIHVKSVRYLEVSSVCVLIVIGFFCFFSLCSSDSGSESATG